MLESSKYREKKKEALECREILGEFWEIMGAELE